MVLSIIVNAIQHARRDPANPEMSYRPRSGWISQEQFWELFLNKVSRSHERHRSRANPPADEKGSAKSTP
jgi:hypothetical protein